MNDLLSCTAAGLEKKSLRNRRREILIKTSPACTQWMHFNLNYTFLPLFSPKKIKLNQVIYILFIQTIQMQAINRAVLDEPQSCVWWRNHLNNRNYFKSFWTKQTKTLISFCHRVSRLPSWQFWGNWGSDSYSVTCDYGKLTNWYKNVPNAHKRPKNQMESGRKCPIWLHQPWLHNLSDKLSLCCVHRQTVDGKLEIILDDEITTVKHWQS